MRLFFLLLGFFFFFSCSDNRECECGDDITFYWKNGIHLDNAGFEIPNAVLIEGQPLAISVYQINQ